MLQVQQDLWLSARTNKVEKLSEALKMGAAIDGVDGCGCTPLMNAAASLMACPETMKALLDLGANHALTDPEGHTALMFAAWRGRPSDVSSLLAAGADPTVVDRDGKTALDHARARGHGVVVALLRPLTPDAWRGADIGNLRDLSSPLCSAVVSFIHRAEAAGMRGVIQSDEMPQSLRDIIPQWYALVITSVPLAGLGFGSFKPDRGWINGGWFRPISDLAQAHQDSYPEIEFVKAGYFAFASSDDGNVWVIRSADQFSAPVFLWDSSSMEPIEAYSSFPLFLPALEVTNSES
jgi:hypothetical protein